VTGEKIFWKRIYDRLVRMHGTPERVAAGVALGVALGVAPTFGLGLVLAAGLAALFKINVVAAAVGSLAGVPVVVPFIWLASCFIGAWLLGMEWEVLYGNVKAGSLWKTGGELLLAYAIGNVILTVVLTALAYLITLQLLRYHLKKPPSPPSRQPS